MLIDKQTICSIVIKCLNLLPRLKAQATVLKLFWSMSLLLLKPLIVHRHVRILIFFFFFFIPSVFQIDVTKFFGCELGAQVQMNAKEDRYIVNGAHDCEKLQNLLDGFIKRFVLCPNCDNPETKLVSP